MAFVLHIEVFLDVSSLCTSMACVLVHRQSLITGSGRDFFFILSTCKDLNFTLKRNDILFLSPLKVAECDLLVRDYKTVADHTAFLTYSASIYPSV